MATRRSGQGFARSDRISEQIRRELAEILRFGIKDPHLAKLLSLVTITDVEVSADYSHAKVFYTSLADEASAPATEQGLSRLSGHLRKELGRRIRLHQIPALHFKFDASVIYGAQLSKLIDDTIAADDASSVDREGDVPL